MFEVTEAEPARDAGHLRSIFAEYMRHGDFQPDVVKLDMALVRNIHLDRVRQSIARSVVSLCDELHMAVIAEGVETIPEAIAMRELGVRLFQGYLFARPAVEQLPVVPSHVVAAVRHGCDVASLGRVDRGLRHIA